MLNCWRNDHLLFSGGRLLRQLFLVLAFYNLVQKKYQRPFDWGFILFTFVT